MTATKPELVPNAIHISGRLDIRPRRILYAPVPLYTADIFEGDGKASDISPRLATTHNKANHWWLCLHVAFQKQSFIRETSRSRVEILSNII